MCLATPPPNNALLCEEIYQLVSQQSVTLGEDVRE